MTPGWLLTAIWFVGGVFATGAFWYFLGADSTVGAIVSALGAVGFALLAVVLHVRNDSLRRRGMVPTPVRLLSLVWSYPLLPGENQASWAVKESAVLQGNLGSARDEPGLGVAIVTTEVALAAFGRAADGRIDRCVTWGLQHAQQEPPYLVTAGVRDQSTWGVIEVKPDLRHTLAFGVILARTRRSPKHLDAYVGLAVARQREEDGEWPAESVATTSPVFSALYAVELLHLAVSGDLVAPDLVDPARKARDRGIGWLMRNRDECGMWSTGVLARFPWDRVVASSWVVHRLIQTASLRVNGWRECLESALLAVISGARDSGTWVGCSEAQRQRIEARAAAAVSRVRRLPGAPASVQEAARSYLAEWRDRALRWAKAVPDEELDIATAAFMVEALATGDDLRKWARQVLAYDR